MRYRGGRLTTKPARRSSGEGREGGREKKKKKKKKKEKKKKKKKKKKKRERERERCYQHLKLYVECYTI